MDSSIKVSLSVRQVSDSIGYCGLVCIFCHEAEHCGGCKSEINCCGRHISESGCYQYNCCISKGIAGCWECENAPCGMDMFSEHHDIRNRAFIKCAREEGVQKLAEYVLRNQQDGILYGWNKDYDNLGSEEAVLDLLHNGLQSKYARQDRMVNPYHQKGMLTIETNRLILRKFTLQDADAMFRNWSGDKDVTAYMRWDAHKSVDETRNVLSSWIKSYDKEDFYLWAIVLKGTDSPIGSIGLFCTNPYDMCYETAYCVGKAYWNKGYVTEALKAVMDFGFHTVGINRIEAYHSINNPGSGKVLQKSGMMYEGRARKKYRSHFGFEDCDMYAALKSDSLPL